MNALINAISVISLIVSCFAFGYARSTYKSVLRRQGEQGTKKLDKLLSTREADLTFPHFHEYIQTQGVENISSKDLNRLIAKFGKEVLMMPGFNEYYAIVSNNESSRVMGRLTWWIMIMTAIVTIGTLAMLFKPC